MIAVKMDRMKKQFFDRESVIRSMSRARRKVLSKAGAFVRTRARTSIKKRKKTSQPGTPPSSHTGLLKRGIVFAYDQANDSVVVGPTLLNRKGQKVPETLEQDGNPRGRISVKNRNRRMIYRARPFMRPALEAERDNIAKIWKDSVK